MAPKSHILPFFTRRDRDGREQAVCGQFVTAAELAPRETRPDCWGCAMWLDNLDVIAPEPARDGDRSNNRPQNLVICQDHRYHMLLHLRATVKARGFSPSLYKRCSSCNSIKPKADFWRYRKFTDGYENKCKPCRERKRLALVARRKNEAFA